VLALAQPEHAESSLSKVPWDVILMLAGMSKLLQLVQETGGLVLFTDLLCHVADTSNLTPLLALIAGVISTHSSSSGVVMPVFLALVPQLTQRIGGDPIAMVSAITVGAHLVDVSPLSTIGALCIASAAETEDRRLLFSRLLGCGMSIAVVGAGICWHFFDVLM
jgi:di/tricarboxylate transporter